MGRLLYITNVSLDGYIEDEHGGFDFSEPDEAVFAFITDLVRPVQTWLYGRRLYESMAVWETDPSLAAQSALLADFAGVWQTAPKIVYSTTMASPSTARTRVETHFDPAAVRAVKDSVAGDLAIGGANIAAQAFHAGLIEECRLFVSPVVLGAGKPALPPGLRIDLELLDERRFTHAVYLRYGVGARSAGA